MGSRIQNIHVKRDGNNTCGKRNTACGLDPSTQEKIQRFCDIILYALEDHLGYKKTILTVSLTNRKNYNLIGTRGISEECMIWIRERLSGGLDAAIREAGAPIIIENIQTDDRTVDDKEAFEKEGLRSLFAVPIHDHARALGVIYVFGKRKESFSLKDVDKVRNLGGVLVASFLRFALEKETKRTVIARLEKRSDTLEHLKYFHSLIIQSVPIGVVATDAKGRVVLMNRELERMSRRSPDECLGKKWFDVFGFTGEMRKRLETSFRTGSAQFFPEIHIPVQNGSTQPVEMRTDVIKNERGNILGVVVICSDIAEKKIMEREIEKVERLAAIGRLSASAAHEIRNPLAGISGALQAIRYKLHGGGEMEKIFERVFEEIRRLDNVVEKMQDLAAPGKMQFGRHSISELIEDCTFFLQKSLKLKGIKLFKKLAGSIPPIMMDKSAIKQVIINILLNSVNAMPNGGRLTVRTAVVDRVGSMDHDILWCKQDHYVPIPPWDDIRELPHLVLSITDDGFGIPQTVVPRVFDAFFGTFENGTGLGLYVSARIVALHEGMIGFLSKVGKGSTFYVLLPTKDEGAIS